LAAVQPSALPAPKQRQGHVVRVRQAQLTRHFAPVARGPARPKHLPVNPKMRDEVELPEHMRTFERWVRALEIVIDPVPCRFGHRRLEGLDPP